MKISIDSIRELNKRYGSVSEIMPNGIDELVDKIGAQLGAVEEVIDLGPKYKNIVIAKVVTCVKHPNADNLSLCKIDDGGVVKNVDRDKDGLVQVVCGASNVRKGLLVAWLPPGATVPSSFGKEPFVLEARKLRGEISFGMIASAHELAISDDHKGILEITEDFKPGTDFSRAFGLNGHIVDIENKMFTHRPDCFGFLGIARELAGIQGLKYTSPNWYSQNPSFPKLEADVISLKINNSVPKNVPRFVAIAMSGVKVGSSPNWLRVELAKVGQKSINNIVDYTNFFMLETGQPLHAYDADKLLTIGGQRTSISLGTRMSKIGEKLKLLNGKELTFDDDSTVLITSGDKPVGIGGVMGGFETEVDGSTTNIVIECANFDMYSIRRTSMKYGLFTDAVTRFNKGQSSMQNLAVLAKIVDEIYTQAGGKVASRVFDDNHAKSKNNVVRVSADFVNARLGIQMEAYDIQKLLENVEFDIELTDNKDELLITPPFWRTDIEIPEDIVEEVGRLYGYDLLPLVLPKRDLTPISEDRELKFKQKIREILAKGGANEVLTYSFVHEKLINSVGQDSKLAFKLKNAVSPELQYYRLSIVPSLLDKVNSNIKSGYDEFVLFELNKAHNKLQAKVDQGLPEEFNLLSLVYSANDKLKRVGAAYFRARKFLDYLAKSLDIELEYHIVKDLDSQPFKPFDISRSAKVVLKNTDISIGLIGEFKSSVIKTLKLPIHTSGFEIDTKVLMHAYTGINSYLPISKFPKISQDISLKVPISATFADIFNFAFDNLGTPKNTQFRLLPIDIYQGDDTQHKNITLRLSIVSIEKTLKGKEVNTILENLSIKMLNKFGAIRI